ELAREKRKGTALYPVCHVIVEDFREQARAYGGEDRALLERFFTFGNLYFCRDSQWMLALIPFLRRFYESINTI
ncbi:hypothetical protein, partial [Pseudomonas lactis]|uniref:hypothetical protein n=1 Tax=Pseudomonas lactis TaxID=1615674 RepID=UPI001CC1C8E4